MINVTRKDVMGSSLIGPGWFPVIATKVVTKPANTDQSTNFVFSLQCIDPELKDIRIKDFLINEKGIFSTGMNFLVAAGVPREVLEKIKKKEMDNAPIDENQLLNKPMKAFIANTTFNNRTSNEATDFMPLEQK